MSPIRIATDDPVDLLVAWRAGSTLQGRVIRISPSIQDQLRDVAVAVAAGLMSGHEYSPDADLEDDTHLVAGRDQLLDVELLSTLERGPSLDEASETELMQRPLFCYAVLVGSGQSPLMFIRKRSPVALLRKSIVARLFSGALDQIDPPLFAFDVTFDVIVTRDKVYILNKALFEALFKESYAVLREIPVWVDRFTHRFPVTSTSRDVLIDTVRRNGFLRNKIHAILSQPYIDTLSSEQIEEKLTHHGFDVSVYMRDGEVDFTKTTTRDIIRLLNEDFFVGDFSREKYAAGSKRRMSQ